MPRCIGRAAQRRRRPPGRNPKGRGLLRRGFVARLACSAGATGFASLLPTPQNPSGADDSTWPDTALREWIGTIRLAALVHAFVAFVLILAIIIHIYAAIWVKGSVRAMTRGTVSYGWAWKHHRLWFRDAVKGDAPPK